LTEQVEPATITNGIPPIRNPQIPRRRTVLCDSPFSFTLMKKIPTVYWAESDEPKSFYFRQIHRKISDAIQIWWLDVQPPRAICFDCGTKGATTKFYSLVAGRVKGKWFTGLGTCLSCAGFDNTSTI